MSITLSFSKTWEEILRYCAFMNNSNAVFQNGRGKTLTSNDRRKNDVKKWHREKSTCQISEESLILSKLKKDKITKPYTKGFQVSNYAVVKRGKICYTNNSRCRKSGCLYVRCWHYKQGLMCCRTLSCRRYLILHYILWNLNIFLKIY